MPVILQDTTDPGLQPWSIESLLLVFDPKLLSFQITFLTLS